MAENETASAASGLPTSATGGPTLSHLPWAMIPSFKPGETDINEYTKKLEFLAHLWPPEHLNHLAPRAAMLCEGSSFKRIMRLDATKLKVNSMDGVKLLVTTLGGIWGKSNLEDKFERFERAIFTTVQRQDEAHESYLARHDVQFEELLQMGVGFEEVRAYVLLRNSGLSAEDKKKLIVDAKGALEYKSIVSSLKLLGSKFSHELQTGNRSTARNKTYDVNAVFDDEPPACFAEEETAYVGEMWDEGEIPFDENDPDAVVCMQFEDSLVDALQGDPDLAACYNTYVDARKRLSDRNKNRGFWVPNKGHGPNVKGKFKGKPKGWGKGRKPLAQRILESECRRCGARGHWKAECPLNRSSSTSTAMNSAKDSAFAGLATALTSQGSDDADMIPMPSSMDVPRFTLVEENHEAFCFMGQEGKHAMSVKHLTPDRLSRFLNAVKGRLSPPQKSQSETQPPMFVPTEASESVAMFVSHGPYGIVDLGASQTVIGQTQLNDLWNHLPKDVQAQTHRVPCSTVFRFGNSSTVTCQYALLIPLAKWYVKLCVVESQTPFLISNNVFRTLGARIDTAQDEVQFASLGFSMKLSLSEKKLYLVDFCELIRKAQQSGTSAPKTAEKPLPVMHVHEGLSPSVSDVESRSVAEISVKCDPVDQSHSVFSDVQQQSSVVGRSVCSRRGTEAGGRVPEDVVCPALRSSHQLRRDEAEPALHRCGEGRSKVREVVCQEVCQERETKSSLLPVLPEPVCGAHGAHSGTLGPGRSTRESSSSELTSQSQVCPSSLSTAIRGGQLVRRGLGTILECASRSESTRGTIEFHGRDSCADRAADPSPVPDGDGPEPASTVDDVRAGHDASEFRSWICDENGCQVLKQTPEQVVDQAYFQDVLNNQVDRANWVYEEMWTYWKKKHPQFQLHEFQRHFSTSHCDLLEVYCSEDSQLTQQTSKLGLNAQRFSLRHGDLSTFQGRCKLYDVLWVLRPQHVWTAPRCGPWSNWNRFNASKSPELADRIMAERRSENVHLLLCDALFRVQDWRGDFFHFHLEQPQGSELAFQKEMETIIENTFKAICDMCTAGKLKHPTSHDYLRKRTQILTTSEIVWRTIQRSQCVGEHHHDSVAGSCKPLGQHRMAVSKFSELYTATFGHRVGRAIQCSCQVSEKVFGLRSQSAFVTEPAHETPEPKRRRLSGKFHPEQLFAPLSSETSVSHSSVSSSSNQLPESQQLPTISTLLEMAEQCAPRVGKAVFQDGPLFHAIQTRYPDKQVVVVDVCRGVDRLRTCPIGSKGLAPFRRSFGKRRTDLQVIEDPEWESWETLSRRQQIRSGTPAKIRVTIFATNKRLNHSSDESLAEDKRVRFSEKPEAIANPSNPHENNPDNTDSNPNNTHDVTLPSPDTSNPIKCQDHGPRFHSLDSQMQNLIKKVHQNLGHPDNRVLQLALRRAGWPERDVVACSDFRCPTCVEHQLPKVARPGKLSSPKDFNDHVSFDGAEWRDPQGKPYPFYHFIDSATNFHVAIPYQQRTTEGLIDAFSTAWLRWAGPPKSLMFDSTTEANSELFAHFLQEQAIQSYVIPTDAHWQLGRAERHGATLLRMIDKYHEEKPIRNAEDFNQCLLQLCHAKNAMSRHEGYTPELWVLGKMKPIPGSNMTDFLDSASFRGLDCESTEGSRFQEQLAKREAARVAFIRADHCANLRRALHARSRPDRMHFSVGDFVMYWKSGKGVEPGSWHGPAKVLMLEQPNMVWIWLAIWLVCLDAPRNMCDNCQLMKPDRSPNRIDRCSNCLKEVERVFFNFGNCPTRTILQLQWWTHRCTTTE